ncbi:MAG: response regulator [Gemmatimonadetes bacterium]|nr:response regulator [Gemmatimonadota bacterium]
MMRDQDPIQRRTILCVDDDDEILRELRQLLSQDGHDVLLATSGPQGLEILAKHDVALIISNQTMPGMVGSRFLEESREVAPDAIRIMLTGHTDSDTAIQAINEGGIHRYLTKPWDDRQLRMTVFEHLRTHAAQERTRDLLAQLQEKNQQLERFNADLEMLVVERSKELFYRVRELEGRDRLARFMMTVHSLEEPLDHLLSVVGETLEAQAVEIHLTDADPSRVTWPVHAVPLDSSVTTSLLDKARAQGKSVLTHMEDAYMCAAPILRDEEILAVIILSGSGNVDHAHEEVKILAGLALAAAVAIHEAREGYDVGGWRDALDDALSRVDDLID